MTHSDTPTPDAELAAEWDKYPGALLSKSMEDAQQLARGYLRLLAERAGIVEMCAKVCKDIAERNNRGETMYDDLAASIANQCYGEIMGLLPAQAEAKGEAVAQELQEAQYLATLLWEKHYKQESPNWKPLGTVSGVLSQISNMTSGLIKELASPQAAGDREDAERYRWLRKDVYIEQVEYNSWYWAIELPANEHDNSAEQFDAAIDAARAADKGG